MADGLRPRDPDEPHRVSTQLELLFDLVTVVALAAVTAGLHHAISEGHGVEKLPVFILLFVVIWWAWMNFTWFASAFDNDGVGYRITVMFIMTGELIFAGGAGHIFRTLDIGWGVVGWTIMRLGMAALWLRASANPEYRTTSRRYAIGILVAQACWIAFYFIAKPGSAVFYPLFVLFFSFEIAVPVFAEKMRKTPFHRHHIIERYGLLMIISLGEVMTAISLGFAALHEYGFSRPAIVTGASGVIIVFAIFSIYFCEREHLTSRAQTTAIAWGYSHVLIFGAVAVLGAGISSKSDIDTSSIHATSEVVSRWIGSALALFFAVLWFARDRNIELGHRRVALPAMALAVIVAGATDAPIWVFSVLGVAAVVWRVPAIATRRSGP